VFNEIPNKELHLTVKGEEQPGGYADEVQKEIDNFHKNGLNKNDSMLNISRQ